MCLHAFIPPLQYNHVPCSETALRLVNLFEEDTSQKLDEECKFARRRVHTFLQIMREIFCIGTLKEKSIGRNTSNTM
jgi:hypothetical protein